jgi:hypothetical protein
VFTLERTFSEQKKLIHCSDFCPFNALGVTCLLSQEEGDREKEMDNRGIFLLTIVLSLETITKLHPRWKGMKMWARGSLNLMLLLIDDASSRLLSYSNVIQREGRMIQFATVNWFTPREWLILAVRKLYQGCQVHINCCETKWFPKGESSTDDNIRVLERDAIIWTFVQWII